MLLSSVNSKSATLTNELRQLDLLLPNCSGIFHLTAEQTMSQHEEEDYHAKDAIAPAVKSAGITGFAGVFVASIQATLTRRNIGALGTFTHYGGTIATFSTESEQSRCSRKML